MKVEEFRRVVLEPGAAWLEAYTGVRSDDAARRFLLAVALQESGLKHRAQVIAGGAAGPARGFWQFEEGGGVAGVLRHPTSRPRILVACEAASVEPERPALWRVLEGHDLLAYACARLLLLTDPYAIPTQPDAAWSCYVDRLWRPGKPHKSTWGDNWRQAVLQYPLA